jgi:hypothetical protein
MAKVNIAEYDAEQRQAIERILSSIVGGTDSDTRTEILSYINKSFRDTVPLKERTIKSMDIYKMAVVVQGTNVGTLDMLEVRMKEAGVNPYKTRKLFNRFNWRVKNPELNREPSRTQVQHDDYLIDVEKRLRKLEEASTVEVECKIIELTHTVKLLTQLVLHSKGLTYEEEQLFAFLAKHK